MKYLITLIIIAAAYIGNAQTAETIIEKHLKACGGKEQLKQIDNLLITGQFTAFSLEKPFKMWWFGPDKYYTEYSLGKFDVRESYHPEQSWVIDPWLDILYPRQTNSAEENMFEQKAALFSPFLYYENKDYTVEYKGKENIEGQEMYVLDLKKSDRNIETWYLDTETYLPYKSRTYWTDFAWPTSCETYYDDYREVSGMMLPHYTEQTFSQRNRQTVIEQVEVNSQLDSSLLQMPRSEAMQKLEFFRGLWDVEVFSRSRRGDWYPRSATVSDIQFSKLNLLEENISYEQYFASDKRLTFSFSDIDKSYRMTVFNALGSEMLVFDGQFNDTALVFNQIVPDANADNSVSAGRYIYSEITNNRFILEIHGSRDGESWQPRERFIYTRKQE